MNREEHFFLQLLADYVHQTPTQPPQAGLDWGKLVRIAKAQGLSGVTWLQCRGLPDIPASHLEQLHRGFRSDVFYAVCRGEDLQALEAAFHLANIPFLPMKGAVLAQYHPVASLRTMGDIDLVIHPQDRLRAHRLMLELGFQVKVDNHAVWTYTRDVVTYELHDHMMYETLASQVDYRSYFDRVWDHAAPAGSGSRWEMDEEFHFLYLVAHTAKHVLNSGSGLRPFLDMALWVRRSGTDMDWQWISRELEKLELLDFAGVCFALCGKWFQVDMPLSGAGVDRSFYEEATRKVFQDGLFGLDNTENQDGTAAKAIRRSQSSYWLAAAGITLRKLFPSYRDMQLVPWYSFVDGRPWLLPAAWLYRFYYCLKHKPSHSRRLLEQPYARREEIGQRQIYMEKWGL